MTATVKFSQLPNLTTIQANTTIPVVDTGNNYTVTTAALQTFVNSTTGNVTASYFIGNGSQLTGLPAVYGNANVAAFLPSYSGNIANLTITGTTTLNPYVETIYSAGSISGSYTPTASLGPVQSFTPTGSFTLNAPTGMATGQSITLIITQPAGGGAVMTPNTAYKFAYGINTLTTTGNAVNMLSIFYTGTTYLCNLVKGYV